MPESAQNEVLKPLDWEHCTQVIAMKQKYTAWLGFLLGAATVFLTTFGHSLVEAAQNARRNNRDSGDNKNNRASGDSRNRNNDAGRSRRS